MSDQGRFALGAATGPLPPSSGGVVLIGGRDEAGEDVGSVTLHAWQHVLVDGHRERRCRVAEAFADDLQRDPVLQHQRRVRVTQVVQPDRRHTSGPLQPVDGLRQGVGMYRPPVGAGEHGRVGRDGSELDELVLSPLAQHVHGSLVEVDRSSRGAGLGGCGVDLVAGAADRPVTRSFWFGGESGRPPGEIQPLRAVFDAREFARFMKTRSAADRDIIARVVIANDVGRTLFETTRQIEGDFVTEVKAALPAQRPTIPAQIVALELDEGLADGTAAVLRVTLNIERSALPVNRLTVHYEFLDDSGAPLTESHSPSELAGTVVAVELSLRGKAMVGRWYQTHLTIPLTGIPPNGSRPTTIVASTFSSNGEYWETVQSRLSPARMTSLKSRVNRRSQAAALPTPVSAEGSDVASSGAGALFAKLRSALIG